MRGVSRTASAKAYLQTQSLRDPVRAAPRRSDNVSVALDPAKQDLSKVVAAKLREFGEQLLRQDAEFKELRRSASSYIPLGN